MSARPLLSGSVVTVTEGQSGETGISGMSSGGEAGNPATPLKRVKGKNGFIYPAIWCFPPFFTLQPNPNTRAHQIDLWIKLILDWTRSERVWIVNTQSDIGEVGEVFYNELIRRRLLPASLQIILAAMVKSGRAVPDPPKQMNAYLIYWKRPEDWGSEIYEWIMANGMGGTILTFWEISEGEVTEGTDFHGMPPSLLRKAVNALVKKGSAQVIKADGEAGEGVRFF